MYCHVFLSAFVYCRMDFGKRAWIIAEDDTQCSASADTVVIQSEDEDQEVVVLRSGRTLADVARNAAGKKAAATCETCESRHVNNSTCISGNLKLCEMCDLSAWAASVCSACGDCPTLPQAQKRCADQHLCENCDRDRFITARSCLLYVTTNTYLQVHRRNHAGGLPQVSVRVCASLHRVWTPSCHEADGVHS
jgi:hypothetical protein